MAQKQAEKLARASPDACDDGKSSQNHESPRMVTCFHLSPRFQGSKYINFCLSVISISAESAETKKSERLQHQHHVHNPHDQAP